MARYVDLDKLSEELRGRKDKPFCDWVSTGILTVFDYIDGEDVAPVVHAHWTITYESTAGVTDAKCSNCGFESLAYENDVHTDERCNYCPCCGAKMDEAEQ